MTNQISTYSPPTHDAAHARAWRFDFAVERLLEDISRPMIAANPESDPGDLLAWEASEIAEWWDWAEDQLEGVDAEVADEARCRIRAWLHLAEEVAAGDPEVCEATPAQGSSSPIWTDRAAWAIHRLDRPGVRKGSCVDGEGASDGE